MRIPNPEVQEAHWRRLVAGAKEAVKAAKEIIESGGMDMKTFELEVWRRVARESLA
jgi:hypothetical protein